MAIFVIPILFDMSIFLLDDRLFYIHGLPRLGKSCLTLLDFLHVHRIPLRGDLLEVIVSNPIACEGIQFPTDHFNDPFLV